MSDTINTQLRMLAAEAREMGFDEAEILDRAADLHDELLAALKPFADLAAHYPLNGGFGMRPRSGDPLTSISSGGLPDATITVDDLHAARAALAKATGGRVTDAETQPDKAGA